MSEKEVYREMYGMDFVRYSNWENKTQQTAHSAYIKGYFLLKKDVWIYVAYPLCWVGALYVESWGL